MNTIVVGVGDSDEDLIMINGSTESKLNKNLFTSDVELCYHNREEVSNDCYTGAGTVQKGYDLNKNGVIYNITFNNEEDTYEREDEKTVPVLKVICNIMQKSIIPGREVVCIGR